MMLKLSNAGRLPTLANHCFIVGEAKRADVIWSEGDFKALCEHMLNDNPPDHFLSAWTDKASAQPRFAKAAIYITLTTGSMRKRGNGRWKPSRYYCNNRSFILSFALPVTAITYSSTLTSCIRLADGSHF